MKISIFKNRYSIIFAFILFFLITSFIVRTVLFFLSLPSAGFALTDVLRIFSQGLIFDLGVSIFFSLLYALYLLVLPQKWNNTRINRTLTYIGFCLVIFLIMFSFFAEFTFWDEFESRFNFIAVDYLIYTYEVINNINESYPLPLLISGMVLITTFIFWLFYRKQIFKYSFNSDTSLVKRALYTVSIIFISFIYLLFVKNSWAEKSDNRYTNELSKAGIYSFFAAYKNNEISYDAFYKQIDRKEAFDIIRKDLQESGATFTNDSFSIRRIIDNGKMLAQPNVIMITIESFSADFMSAFGNKNNLTPFLDSLAQSSVLFTNLYATGTRTIRGMEALSLSIPPTPGSSIVRRPNNNDLFTVGTIFENAGYKSVFVYGGDGYFDNMNQYFGSNGFDIIDRGRNIMAGDNFKANRTIIADKNVHFENAWGISDEDLYDALIRDADNKYKEGKKSYDFVMTTSNHKPYTYPAGKIDIPSGAGRDGAVKYTDYAIRQFFHKIKDKPWYKNTVIILVADHCANSAGKNEIDISKYHIPALIVNLPPALNQKIEKMCSQIDIYPTLFSLLGWKYESNLYGKNVLSADYTPRIILGTYQKLAYMKNDSLLILGPQKTVQTYLYNKSSNEQIPFKLPEHFIKEGVSHYQTAYYLYKNEGLKLHK